MSLPVIDCRLFIYYEKCVGIGVDVPVSRPAVGLHSFRGAVIGLLLLNRL